MSNMIIREMEGGEGIEVIREIGPGEIESIKAGIASFIRLGDDLRYEQCLYVDDNDEPIWELLNEGEPWLTAKQAEESYQKRD